jgi:hypothetical protein
MCPAVLHSWKQSSLRCCEASSRYWVYIYTKWHLRTHTGIYATVMFSNFNHCFVGLVIRWLILSIYLYEMTFTHAHRDLRKWQSHIIFFRSAKITLKYFIKFSQKFCSNQIPWLKDSKSRANRQYNQNKLKHTIFLGS